MPTASTIAIDGPVAAGKTVVGRLVAQRLGYRFLDTGLMYRVVGWLAWQRNIRAEDQEALARLARCSHIELVNLPDGADQVTVDGQDVAGELASPEVARWASLVAQVPGVREALVAKQQKMAREGHIVVVGRDIGTVVLPDADLKVFLVASHRERARRRHQELLAASRPVELESVLRELEERDRRDSERGHSPLRPAKDAVLVDTDGLDVAQVVERILVLAEVQRHG